MRSPAQLGSPGMGSIVDFCARVSVMAPFEHTALIWAFLLGLAVWGDVPSAAVFVGAALIVAGGLVVGTP